MGAFNINITGVGGHGCERKAKAGDPLYGRCGRFTCPDCMAYDFVQRMKQSGMLREGDQAYSIQLSETDPRVVAYQGARLAWIMEHGGDEPRADFKRNGVFRATGPTAYWLSVPMEALFTHWPSTPGQVVDDMLKNERKSGAF
jgi:hypothetical protein